MKVALPIANLTNHGFSHSTTSADYNSRSGGLPDTHALPGTSHRASLSRARRQPFQPGCERRFRHPQSPPSSHHVRTAPPPSQIFQFEMTHADAPCSADTPRSSWPWSAASAAPARQHNGSESAVSSSQGQGGWRQSAVTRGPLMNLLMFNPQALNSQRPRGSPSGRDPS